MKPTTPRADASPDAVASTAEPSAVGLLLGLAVVATGLFWLLWTASEPDAGWIWAATLATTGVAVFAVHRRIDKWTIVAGPFLLLAAGGSVLRQLGWLELATELPLLVIALGLLILLSQHRLIPMPRWYGPGC